MSVQQNNSQKKKIYKEELVTSTLTLQEMLKDVLQVEGKSYEIKTQIQKEVNSEPELINMWAQNLQFH